MRINLKEYAKSLGVDDVNLIDIFKRLGYFDDEIFRNVVVNHPLTTLKFDFGLVKYGEDRYGMIVCIEDVNEENKRKLEGMCKLVGAKYGILTNLKDMVVLREDGTCLDYVPNRDTLKLELGLIDACALAISYEDFEKVDDVDFVVCNSRYIYSDMDNDRVVVFLPNRILINWLKERKIKFEILDEEEACKVVDKFVL
ncbi:hypothetical protein [Archaeoglobus sp.]